MPNYFPCPNTQCSYQFDADILPAAAMVTCPLCRTKFPYRASKPNANQGEGKTAQRLVAIRNAPKSGGILITAAWVGGFVVILAGLLGAYFVWMNKKISNNKEDERQDRYNFVIEKLGKDWVEDTKTRTALDTNIFARKRTDPESYIAMWAIDYNDRNPRRGELRDKLLVKLKNEFVSSINLVELEGAKWAGQPALAYSFDGDVNEVHVRGECYAMSYKGIAYGFYLWAPAQNWDAVKEDLQTMRSKFKLADYRENWSEKKVSTIVYNSPDGKFKVEDRDAKWIRAMVAEEGQQLKKEDWDQDPKTIDPSAVMAFRASERPKNKDLRSHTMDLLAIVVELDKEGSPLENVKNHLQERLKREVSASSSDIKLDAVPKSPGGLEFPPMVAMERYVFQNPIDRDNRKMYIISAIKVGDKTIGMEVEVQERYASYVEEWMINLASSLKEN